MYEIVANGKCLEIGGGSRPLLHPNMDVRAIPGVDLVWNLSEFPWPVDDESIDTVVGIYVAEHIAWPVFDAFIKEIQRILKPGGKAVFLTSNLEAQAKRIIREGVNMKTVECLFGTIDYKENAHAMGFSPSSVKELFKGFDVNAIAPMPDVVFKGQVIYPGSETDLLIELTKPGIKMKQICKNLGSFIVYQKDTENEDWENLDVINLSDHAKQEGVRFKQHDLRSPLPYQNNSIDFLNMSHLLEHFMVPEGLRLLRDCLRVLRPGGLIRVCVPDLQVLVNAYVNRNMSLFDSIQPEEYKPCTESEKLWRMITSGPPELIADARWEGHKTAYDSPGLYHALKEAGFTDITTVPFDKRYDTFPEVAVVMTGKKPEYVPPQPEIQGKVQYEIIIPTVNKNITVSENRKM